MGLVVVFTCEVVKTVAEKTELLVTTFSTVLHTRISFGSIRPDMLLVADITEILSTQECYN